MSGDELESRSLRGLKIRAARKARLWTQWDLADELNEAAGTPFYWRASRVSEVERLKRRVQPDEVELFERVLGIDL